MLCNIHFQKYDRYKILTTIIYCYEKGLEPRLRQLFYSSNLRDGPLFFWRGGGGGGGGGGNEKSLSANFFLYLCTSANNFFLTTPSCKQFFFDLF